MKPSSAVSALYLAFVVPWLAAWDAFALHARIPLRRENAGAVRSDGKGVNTK